MLDGIGKSYNFCYSNTTGASKTANNQVQRETTATGVGQAAVNSTGNSTAKYLQEFHQKFPEANITLGNYVQGTMFGSGNVGNFMIAPAILRKMANESETAAKYEEIIGDCIELDKQYNAKANMEGMEIVASGTIIDANGGISHWSSSRTIDSSADKEKSRIEKSEETQDVELKSANGELTQKRIDARRIQNRILESYGDLFMNNWNPNQFTGKA